MIKGVSEQNTNSFLNLCNEAKRFLQKLHTIFQEEISLLEGQALAESRFLTAFVDTVAFANLAKSIATLDKLEQQKDPRIAEKLLNYLQRTQEFLIKSTQNKQDGAQFIPVPFHKKNAEQHQALLTECNDLIRRSNDLVTPSAANRKSWLSLFVNLANLLPNIRAASFGLAKEDKQPALDRLRAIVTELTALEQKTDDNNAITKTSKRVTGATSFTAEPSVDSLYHQYVPPLRPVFDSFKSLMQNPVEQLTKKAVLEAVKTDYPTPRC